MVSDAARLPASTNMGLGHDRQAPAAKAQPVNKKERAMIPTEQEKEKATRDTYAATTHSWEEDDVDTRPGEYGGERKRWRMSSSHLDILTSAKTIHSPSSSPFQRRLSSGNSMFVRGKVSKGHF